MCLMAIKDLYKSREKPQDFTEPMNAFNYTRLKRLRAAGESTSANRASSVVRVGGVRGDIVVD
jgi:hypothetical protein